MEILPSGFAVNYSIILFDGVCNLCNSSVSFIIKRDKKNKFRFVPLQSPAGEKFVKKYNIGLEGIDSIILIEDDRYYIKSTSVLKIAGHLSRLCKIFYFLLIIPRPFRDFGYDIVAKHRYNWFGRKNECMVPDEEVKDRFFV